MGLAPPLSLGLLTPAFAFHPLPFSSQCIIQPELSMEVSRSYLGELRLPRGNNWNLRTRPHCSRSSWHIGPALGPGGWAPLLPAADSFHHRLPQPYTCCPFSGSLSRLGSRGLRVGRSIGPLGCRPLRNSHFLPPPCKGMQQCSGGAGTVPRQPECDGESATPALCASGFPSIKWGCREDQMSESGRGDEC